MPVDLSGHTFHIHELDDGNELGIYVGGSDDLPSAIVIMSAVYSTVQDAYQDNARVFVTVDDNGIAVAFIGRNPQQAGLPS